MNPWAFIVIAIGVLIIILGIKGTQHNVVGALVGHKTGSTSTPTKAGSNSGPILA